MAQDHPLRYPLSKSPFACGFPQCIATFTTCWNRKRHRGSIHVEKRRGCREPLSKASSSRQRELRNLSPYSLRVISSTDKERKEPKREVTQPPSAAPLVNNSNSNHSISHHNHFLSSDIAQTGITNCNDEVTRHPTDDIQVRMWRADDLDELCLLPDFSASFQAHHGTDNDELSLHLDTFGVQSYDYRDMVTTHGPGQSSSSLEASEANWTYLGYPPAALEMDWEGTTENMDQLGDSEWQWIGDNYLQVNDAATEAVYHYNGGVHGQIHNTLL